MNYTEELPRKIDKYDITHVLGQGAMGIVYKGYDKRIDRQVAIKVLHPHLRQGEMGRDLMARFTQEAKAAARCFHPNIVTVFDFGMADNTPFIVMEYVRGVELKIKLKSEHSFPLGACLEITLQILEALAYAHQQGVIHRDIKPANIILLENGHIKISDFGVARLDTSDLTGTGYMVGTPNYMSPEGLRGDIVDLRSDLYSTGLVLFELLTKQKLARGIPLDEALLPIHQSSQLTVTQAHQLLPIIEKTLQAMPQQRHQTAAELISSLRALEYYDADEAKTILKQVSSITKLDATRPSPATKPVLSPLVDSTSLSQWNPDILKSIEQNLAKFIGPMSRYVVHKIAKKSRTVSDLSQSLASQIPSEKERIQFLRELEKSGIRENEQLISTSGTASIARHTKSIANTSHQPADNSAASPNQEIPHTIITDTSKRLTFYLGPLANRLVKKAVNNASNIQEFYQLLAQHIPDDKERNEFLRQVHKH